MEVLVIMQQYGILVNLDRCVGCFACEVACKDENNVPVGEQWIKVHTVGPAKVDEKLYTKYFPLLSESCTMCSHRIARDLEPFCVYSCPVKALTFGKADSLIGLLRESRKWQVAGLKEVNTAENMPSPN